LNRLINHQGSLLDPETPVATAFNRSLRYGDGLFETMYWNGKEILNEGFHLDRLFQGLHTLQFDLSGHFSRAFVSAEILRICEHNAPEEKARVRLNVFREEGASLFPAHNQPIFIIETAGIPEQNQLSVRLMKYTLEKKSTGILSNLKTNNYLLNIIALQHAKTNGFDDALLVNSHHNFCEASSSNVFMIRRGIIFTPALSEGCVAGTKRRELIEKLNSLGLEVKETALTGDLLAEMEEGFLTNAIQAIRSVACIDDQLFTNQQTQQIIRVLNNCE